MAVEVGAGVGLEIGPPDSRGQASRPSYCVGLISSLQLSVLDPRLNVDT